MVIKRPDNNSDRDVSIKNTVNPINRKFIKFSGAMIKLGVYVTYCVLLLIKKMSRLFVRCSAFFSSRVTSMLSSMISKLKKAGKSLLSPFFQYIRVSGRAHSAKRELSDDMSVKSIRTTTAGRILSCAYNYALPAAAVTAFAVVINSTSKIEAGIDDCIGSAGYDVRSLTESLASASDDLGEVTDEDFFQKKVEFEDPVKALSREMNTENMQMVSAFGVYADGELIGAVTDTDPVDQYLRNRLEEIVRSEGVTEACYKKKITYKNELFAPEFVTDTEKVISYFENDITEEYYTIEEGDSFCFIAEDHGMTLDELMELNPELEDYEMCFAGNKIRVSCHKESMPVIITRQEEETVSVPFDSMTVDSDSLFTGETEILVDGVNGESVNIVNVRYEGSRVLSREVVSTRRVTEPVPEMIAVGTKTTQVSASPWSEETVLTGTGKFMWPVNGGWISDPFGSDRSHKGLDIAAGEGTDIYAAADGKVVAAGWNTGGYGYFVMIDHGEGYVTLYAHMSKVIASNGSLVKCGDLIGEVGTTGDSTGDHLHFEVRYQNICQNPALYLRVNAPDDAVVPESLLKSVQKEEKLLAEETEDEDPEETDDEEDTEEYEDYWSY